MAATEQIDIDITKVKERLAELQKQMDSLSDSSEDYADVISELSSEYDTLNRMLDNATKASDEYMKSESSTAKAADNNSKAQKSLKKEYADIIKQLQKLKLEGKENTATYQSMLKRAGELKDAMSDTNQAVSRMASDTSSLDAILSGASAATGGFGLATSVMSLLGKDTADVEKAQKRLQQAIALVNSVQAIANALNKDSALMVKLNALAYKLLGSTMKTTAASVTATSTAFKGLKSAMITTGVGALVVALGYAANALLDYVEKTNSAKANTNEFVKALDAEKQSLLDTAYALATFLRSYADSKNEIRYAIEELAISETTTEGSIDNLVKKLALMSEKVNIAANDLAKYGNNLARVMFESGNDFDKYADDAANLIKQWYGYIQLYEENIIAIRQRAVTQNRELTEDEKLRVEKNKLEIEHTKNGISNLEKTLNDYIKASGKYVATQQSELQAQKALESAIEAEAKRVAENRLKLAGEIATKRRENEQKELEFLRGDELAYYESKTKLLKKWSDEDIAIENKRYAEELKSAAANGVSKEAIEAKHNEILKSLHYAYLADLQAADDEYNAYLNNQPTKDLKEIEKRAMDAKMINIQNQLTAYQGQLQTELELKLQQLELEKEIELKAAEETGADRQLIIDKYARLEEATRIETINSYVAIANDMVGDLSNVFSALFEDNKQVQIATTVATTIANAAMTFGSVFAQAKGGMAAKAAQAAAASASVIASGVAAINNIKRTTETSSSINGGYSGGGSYRLQSESSADSVANTLITRGISQQAAKQTEVVLVVDDVTAKQREASRLKTISAI